MSRIVREIARPFKQVIDAFKPDTSGIEAAMRQGQAQAAAEAKQREAAAQTADEEARKRRESMARASLADRPSLFETLGERQKLG